MCSRDFKTLCSACLCYEKCTPAFRRKRSSPTRQCRKSDPSQEPPMQLCAQNTSDDGEYDDTDVAVPSSLLRTYVTLRGGALIEVLGLTAYWHLIRLPEGWRRCCLGVCERLTPV